MLNETPELEPTPEEFETPEPYGTSGLVRFRKIGSYIFAALVLICAVILGVVLFMSPQ